MVSKYKISLITNILFALIILSMVLFLEYRIQNRKVSFYSIERTSKDLTLTIENLHLLSLEHGLYIEPNYLIRPNLYGKDKIENIHIKITIDKQPIVNLYLSDMEIIHVQSTPTFINTVDKITDDSKIYIEFEYTVNGQDQTFNTDLRLKDFKSDILYDNSNFKFDKYN